jgi:uncharacterized protein
VLLLDASVVLAAHRADHPPPRSRLLLRRLCEEADALGDLVTLDRDFARFASVRHRRPAGA